MKTDVKLFQVAHEVYCVKIVEKMLLSCGDTTVRFWNLEDGTPLNTLHLDTGSWCNNFDLNSESTLLAVAHYKGVSIYNFSSLVRIYKIELEDVADVRFNEPGTRLIVGQKNGQVSKIDLF